MKRLFILTLLFLFGILTVGAQTKAQAKIDSVKLKASVNEQTHKFKKNDTAYRKLEVDKALEFKNDSADLKLTVCDFEKDANAMVLADKAVMAYGPQIIMERYRRIKIFNDNGKSEANIRIEYTSRYGAEEVLAVIAETINFNNGKIEHTKLDSTLIYNIHTDKQKDAIAFTMPNVKAGSIIQYAYFWRRASASNFPDWDFQCNLPTRNSEIKVFFTPQLSFTLLTNKNQPFTKDTSAFNGYGHTWAMENIPSVKDEPYMRAEADGEQHVSIIIKAVKDNYFGGVRNIADSWGTIGRQIVNDKSFTKAYDQGINDDNGLAKKAKKLKTDEEKIALIFNEVKTQMGWDQIPDYWSRDGIKSAWKKKIGNWGEINMILCHFLKQAGIKAYPMLVSTRDNGILYSNFPNFFQINKLVVYVPVDTAKFYVLDASDKFNRYNEIPYDLLNSNGICLDKEKDQYTTVFLKREQPVKRSIVIAAEIKSDGTMSGTATIYDYSYNKSSYTELYKTLDEKKYKEWLTDNDNNLKITSLKLDYLDVDSLPLLQNIDFTFDLATNDEKYIYFSPNLFTSIKDNPFVSVDRATDIDFGYKNSLSIRASFKLPTGYDVDFLPKNINLLSGDKSIALKRISEVENGYLSVYYSLDYKKSKYPKEDYPNLYAYFKKMYETLNEQIVLKKI